MNNPDRWKQRFENYRKAYSLLREFVARGELNKFEEQGLVQCLEYTLELGWKLMKDYLENEGHAPATPRNTIQLALQAGLISDGHVWIDALEKRNLMSHTYSEANAAEAIRLIRERYFAAMAELFAVMGSRL